MKHIASLLACGLVLVFAIPSLQGQNQQEKTYVCRLSANAIPPASHGKFYLSGVSHLRATDEIGKIAEAWTKYIQETYRLLWSDGRGDCLPLGATQAQQQYTINSLEQHAKALNEEVIHVDWTYTPGQAAAPPGPRTLYGYCHSGNTVPGVVYFSEVSAIPVADAPGDPIPTTFFQFLRQEYSFPTGDEWRRSGAGSLNSWEKDQMEISKERLEADYERQKRRVVETGWKYVRTAQTPPAKVPHSH